LQELHKGANQTAISFFEEATRVDPRFAMAHARLAEAYYNLGNDVVAKQLIDSARVVAEANPLPLAERYQIHAIASRIEDDPEAAVASYRELARLYTGDPSVLLSLASSLETLGKVEEAAEGYSAVLEQAPQYGAALLGLGRMLVLSSRNDQAVSVLSEALESGGFEGDPETMGMIHSILGVAHRDSGQPKLAVVHLEKSLEYRRKADDERGTIATLTNLAILYVGEGDLASAEPLLEEGLSLARNSANSTMESFALINLAVLQEAAGKLDLALEVARQSLEIEWERKEHTELASRLNYIGHLYSSLGRYADAMVYLEQAKVHIAISEEPREKGRNERYRGDVLFAKGSFDDATKSLLKAVTFYREANDLEGAAWSLNRLFHVYLNQGRLRDARTAIDETQGLCKGLSNPRLAATTHINEARILVRLGDLAGSGVALKRAEEILSQMKSHDLRGLFHLGAGEVATARGESTDAMRHWALSRRAQDRDHLIVGLESGVRLGDAERESGDLTNAITLLEEAWTDSQRLRLPVIQARAALALAKTYWAQGRLDVTRMRLEEAIRFADGFGGKPLLYDGYRLSALIEQAEGHETQASEARTRSAEIESWLLDQLPDGVVSSSKL
jgi:tetratricopeptide (TPR) repeat protein